MIVSFSEAFERPLWKRPACESKSFRPFAAGDFFGYVLEQPMPSLVSVLRAIQSLSDGGDVAVSRP